MSDQKSPSGDWKPFPFPFNEISGTAVTEGTVFAILTPVSNGLKGGAFGIVGGVVDGAITYFGDPTQDERQKIGEILATEALTTAAGIAMGAILVALDAPLIGAMAVVGGTAFVLGSVGRYLGNGLFNYLIDPVVLRGLEWLTGVGRHYDPNEFSKLVAKASPFNAPMYRVHLPDPLILDLNGDGIATTNVDRGLAYFDLDGNGITERTGWVDPNDGLLVMDRNGNGKIDDGTELFGDQTILKTGARATDGFQALAEWDDNSDGNIGASDPIWSQLRVWKDTNSDGRSAPDELHSLTEMGIRSIYLNSTISGFTDIQGNTRIRVGSFEKVDGSFSQIGDYSFQRNLADTLSDQPLAVPEDVAALPYLPGFGYVSDLHQAIVRDDSGRLEHLINEFASATDVNSRNALMEEILFVWTKSDNIDPTSRGSDADARKISVIEKFLGAAVPYPPEHLNPSSATSEEGGSGGGPSQALWVLLPPNYIPYLARLNELYRGTSEMMYALLMAQTHLKELYDMGSFTWDEQTQSFEINLEGVISELNSELTNNPEHGRLLLSEFARTIRGLGAQDRVDYLSFRETFIDLDPELGWVIDSGGLPVYEHPGQGTGWYAGHIFGTDDADDVKGSLTEGDGVLNGIYGNDVIYGTDRNEQLLNAGGDAILVGGGGSDVIYAGGGDDTLDGGDGSDLLHGQEGNDTYLFRRGSGQDTIIDYDTTTGNIDTIWLGGNLASDDVTLKRSGNNLILKINDTTDTLTIKDFFRNDSPASRIERIQFMDGTVWTDSDIILQVYSPTDGDDVIYGGTANDSLSGAGGNDTIFGQPGDDTIHGDTGNDNLSGGTGDDFLDGGIGNDVLDGGTGNDTYLFGRGSGQDTIFSQNSALGEADTIALEEGVLPTDIKLERIGNDLKLTITDTSDTVTVKDWIRNDTPGYGLSAIIFADGTVLSLEVIQDILVQGTDGNDVVYGFSRTDTILGGAGDDKLFGRAGDDLLEGGDGIDDLYGEAGNDTLNGGEANDRLLGDTGNDMLSGGAGADTLLGGSGNDTYLFGRDFGQDTIVDNDLTAGNVDTIRLADDLTPADIRLQRNGEHLELFINGTTDKLTIVNWFLNESPEYQVESIEFADGTIWDVDAIKLMVLGGTPGNDTLVGYSSSDTLVGFSGDDILAGRAGDDTLEGGIGNDSLYGEAGNDTLAGGEGNDALMGGAGNDSYLFGRGSGQDTITDYEKTTGNPDTVQLAEDITPGDVTLRRNGYNLELSINGTGDTLTMQNWFWNDSADYQVERIQFADGSFWDVDAIKHIVVQGTSGDDLLLGYSASADTISGLAGDDKLYASGGDDILEGGSGNDILYGESGNDTLNGGEGADYLNGGAGNDTYLFGRNSGQDVVAEYDLVQGNVDTVLLGAGVQVSDIVLKRGDDNLYISIKGTADRLQLTDWFSDDAHKVEHLQFSDGTIWDAAYIEQIVSTPTGTDDILTGTAGADVIDGGGGNDTIYGLGGDDQLLGGDANDYIDGGTGNNVIDGGAGDDQIVADEGLNTIHVNRGGGFDTITSHFFRTQPDTDTFMVKNIYPGGSSNPTNLINVDGTLYFVAADGVHGTELWKSDGTAGGTVMIKDIIAGSVSTSISNLIDVNGTLFFTANDGIHGLELWTSDGTEAGTFLVKDIVTGSGSSNVSNLTNVNGMLFFTANDGTHGIELWMTDGTEAGTVLVKDIVPGLTSCEIANFINVNGTLFFRANDNIHGRELWKSDGTEAGTIMVKDLYPGMYGQCDFLTNVSGTLFFRASDIYGGGLFKSDGSEEGTVKVWTGDIADPIDVNGTLFFRAYDSAHGWELWKSDGTTAGTVIVKDIIPGSTHTDIHNLTNVNGILFFTAWDSNGIELWKSDGTEAGTVMVKDIAPGSANSWPASLTNVNGTLYFTACENGDNSRELWKSDGTEAGTVMVYDILPGSSGSNPANLTNVDGILYFAVNGAYDGVELWRSGNLVPTEQEPDTIVFGDGITPDDLLVQMSVDSNGMELRIGIGNGEGILIQADVPAGATGVTPSDLAVQYFKFADGTVLTLEDILSRANGVAGEQNGSAANDLLQGSETNDFIYGFEGDDTIRSGAGNDIIDGGFGTDFIYAGSGDDIIQGLQGGDTALGGAGDDTYYYNVGDGKVTIDDIAEPGAGNTIVFGEGISSNDITLGTGSLTLKIGDNGDEIHLTPFDAQDAFGSYAVETFRFADGTVLTYAELLQRGFDFSGTEGEDLLTGTSVADRITGFGGDDIFTAGKGDDLLEGGSGNDTYVFNLGDGVDTIRDMAVPGAGNVVEFGLGIVSYNLTLSVDQNILSIRVGDSGDVLRLEGFDPNDPYGTIGVETFRFADGTVLSSADLLDLGFTFEGTSEADIISGTGVRDILRGNQGNDQIAGGAGDDTYVFNVGDGVDTITDESTLMSPNMLVLGAGITLDDIKLNHDATNDLLILNIGTNGDAIEFTNFDSANPYGTHAIEYFRFADGQIVTYSELIDKGFDIAGTSADDNLIGTGTTDRIIGGDGNDTFAGGPGNDTLIGGAGDDTYTFNKGDGILLIDDIATASEGNTLIFGEGIAVADLERSITFSDNTLIIRIGTDGDEVHLTGFDPDAADYGIHAVQKFEFADGTILNYEALVRNTFIVQGDYGDDDLTGTNMTDRLYGYEGSDRLNGGLGDDTLTGGINNDELIGGAGSDMYVFHVGDGVDTIADTGFPADGNTIYFADAEITIDDITTHIEGTTLVISYGDGGDAIRLLNFDYNGQNGGSHVVETIEFADGTQVALSSLVDPGTEGDDTIIGSYFEDVINARGGNDTVATFESNDVIDGGSGTDIIDAGSGDDSITGGTGNDALFGGAGQDTYIFNLGDGIDTLTDTAVLGEGNVIRFGEGITLDDISIHMEGTTLVIQYGSSGDQIRLLDFDYDTQHVVETFQFADGSSMRMPGLLDPGTEGDDIILGSYFEDSINSKGGNDTVTTYESNDIVDGGSGNDIIDVGAGYDLIIGGTGNDTLTGGPGNDRYIFNLGDGIDTVADTATSYEGNVIQFGPGITLDDLKLSYADTTLIISIGTGGDQIRLSGFDREDALGPHAIETFQFSEGTSVAYADLIAQGFDLTGTEGDDTILGTNVVDRIYGLGGNDILDGSAGIDILIGGTGNDAYKVNDSSDIVVENADEGHDIVESSVTYSLSENVEDLTLTGTDSIHGTGNTLNNVLTGNAGDNLLDGGTGADSLVGGAGNDVYLVDNTGDVVVENADEGVDTVQSSVSFALGAHLENLALTGTNDINGTGNELDNILTGNNGDNILDGGIGADSLLGGAGNDTYIVDMTDIVTENTDEGIDTIQSSTDYSLGANLENLILTGIADVNGTGNDLENYLMGNSGINVLSGGLGNDTLDGGVGVDTLQGGIGDDLYILDNAGDIVIESADEGIDTVQSAVSYALAENLENLTLTGDGAINATGNAFNNILIGNNSANVLDGGEGTDTMRGGAGDDTYIVNTTDDGAIENPNEGMDTVRSSVSYTLQPNLENLILIGLAAINGTGNDLDNLLTGNGADNELTGSLGDDTLQGGEGNDTYLFCLGDGLDMITDTSGTDAIRFGQGITRQNISVKSDSSGVHIRLLDAQGNETGEGLDVNALQDGTPSVENIQFADGTTAKVTDFLNVRNVVYGTNGFDIIITGNTEDEIYAKDGIDLVYSGGNNDIIYGGDDLDLLYGEDGNDTIYGEKASDLLMGGRGNDILDGGSGADLLMGGTGDDTYRVDNSCDIVMEGYNEGIDTVESSVKYSLDFSVENLTLTGTSSINGFGNTSNNILIGNSAANKLFGDLGNDTLDGRAGNDTLEGGRGNDTYLFGRGYGTDRIEENDSTQGNHDVLAFGSEMSADQLWFRRSGKDLEISILGTSDKTIITDWYKGTKYQVEEFQTADGKALLNNQVDALVNAMAAFVPPAPGQMTLPENYQTALNPIIAANWR